MIKIFEEESKKKIKWRVKVSVSTLKKCKSIIKTAFKEKSISILLPKQILHRERPLIDRQKSVGSHDTDRLES